MDGIPIFNLARETLPAVQVAGFRGVVNSTTNYIITAMEDGREFAEALAEMQAAGIAEADASLDVDGWDAAAKAAALANVLLGAADVTPHGRGADRASATSIGAAVRDAVARRKRVQARRARAARRGGEAARARSAPRSSPEDDLLAGLARAAERARSSRPICSATSRSSSWAGA